MRLSRESHDEKKMPPPLKRLSRQSHDEYQRPYPSRDCLVSLMMKEKNATPPKEIVSSVS